MPRGMQELAERTAHTARGGGGERQCRPGAGQDDRRDGADVLPWKKQVGGLRIDQAKRLEAPGEGEAERPAEATARGCRA